MRCAKFENGNPSPRQVLLVTDVLVRCKKSIKARFRLRKQHAILETFPASFMNCGDFMSRECPPQGTRNTFIKENLHAAVAKVR